MAGKRGLTNDIVVSAAVNIVEEKGINGLSIQDLAAKLGVKPSSLYNHISGLADIRNGLAKVSLQKLEETIRNVAVGRGGAQALEEMAFAYRRFAKENPELYKAFIDSAVLEDPNVDEAAQSLARVVYRVLESYNLDHEEQIHFTRIFRSNLHGFVSLEAAGFFLKKVDVNETFAKMVKSYIDLLNNHENAKRRG
ncbi:MAG: TetR/AcrR family transcriptional regulator [Acetanaerobacterium sp.]